jgi:TPR repeat protein
MLSPFSRAAKKSPTHPIQCCGRYIFGKAVIQRLFIILMLSLVTGCTSMKNKVVDEVELLIQQSSENNHLAQAELSLIYLEGKQVEQNLGKAFELLEMASQDIYSINKVYKSATKTDNAAAEYGLYAMWSNGWGVPLNHKIATKHLKKSAELGFPRAMYVLGLNYRVNYLGLKEDLELSKYWLIKAADYGIVNKNIQI